MLRRIVGAIGFAGMLGGGLMAHIGLSLGLTVWFADKVLHRPIYTPPGMGWTGLLILGAGMACVGALFAALEGRRNA